MRYLVTGGAGFIGSNLVEALLNKAEEVVVLDNISTGKLSNIESFIGNPNFRFIRGSVTDPETCAQACEGVDYILHQAAFVSVPWSVEEPVSAHETNVTGTVNIFTKARDAGVKRVVWASSTSVYGNSDILPNVESMPLCPLSPYAASKAAGEMYARAFSEVYSMSIISLRYYNVFGKRQDPASQYAAAIPIFISRVLKGEPVTIYGDGEQTRDFVYIDNVVQANIRAATSAKPESNGKPFNIGYGSCITINKLYSIIARELGSDLKPVYAPVRPGDVRDSVADINAARDAFGYNPTISVEEGIHRSIEWYRKNIT
jgi:nucleoside-diphosphate-sugar epimerase